MPKSSKRKVVRKHTDLPGRPPVKVATVKPPPDTIWTRFRKNPMAPIGLLIIFTMVVTLVGAGVFGGQATPTPPPTAVATATPAITSTPAPGPPAMSIDPAKAYTATIVTDRGTMVFSLLPKVAPVTVNSFVSLARKGFYNGLTFHRVEPGFVIQGGDPLGNGSGGPGYSLPAEFNATKHITGTLAMARADDINSAGSQFYVALAPVPSLDNKYTVFGQIVSGMDVALKTVKGDVMRQVTIEEK